jgi:hypothetical protein
MGLSRCEILQSPAHSSTARVAGCGLGHCAIRLFCRDMTERLISHTPWRTGLE